MTWADCVDVDALAHPRTGAFVGTKHALSRKPSVYSRPVRRPSTGRRPLTARAASGIVGRMKVVVATTQDLFVRGGGATYHADGLAGALAALGHEVEMVRIPFGWRHKYEVLRQAYQWRMLDLREPGADLVITLKFPAFYVRADRKVAWVLHQHRPLYDNFDLPEYSAFSSQIDEDVAMRDAVRRWDTTYLARDAADLHQLADGRGPAAPLQRDRGRAALPSAAAGRPAASGALRRLRALGRTAGGEQAAGPPPRRARPDAYGSSRRLRRTGAAGGRAAGSARGRRGWKGGSIGAGSSPTRRRSRCTRARVPSCIPPSARTWAT